MGARAVYKANSAAAYVCIAFMKRFWLCLLGAATIILSSCNSNTETINIEWVVLGDISGIGFFERPIYLGFMNASGRTASFWLRPERTNRIRLQRDMNFFQRGLFVDFDMEIYPLSVPGLRQRLWDYRAMEIFLHHLWYYKKTEDSITLVPHEKVLLYFFSFFRGGREYLIFSRSNEIPLDLGTAARIDDDGYSGPSRVLEIMQENNLDLGYFYRSRAGDIFIIDIDDGDLIATSVHGGYSLGYLVESRLSSTGLKLITSSGLWVEE